MRSLQGHFLLASPDQPDPTFAETVVLVVEHTDQGAFGVVMNSEKEPDDVSSDEDYAAGEVAGLGVLSTGPRMAIHAERYLAETKVLPGVFFSAKEENVLLLMDQTDQPYKIFTGYVEWGKGQLDDDLRRGLWRSVPATAEQIFSAGADLWARLSRPAPPPLFDLFDPKHASINPLLN